MSDMTKLRAVGSVVPDLPFIEESVLSNFGGGYIDRRMAWVLTDGKCVMFYPAWHFCGYVWRDTNAGEFVCEVWVSHKPVDVLRGTLDEIFSSARAKYGTE
jgi:hypothetical protein